VFTGRRIATRLDERVHRWANWFRDRIRAGDDEQQLTPAFAAYEAEDLREAPPKSKCATTKPLIRA